MRPIMGLFSVSQLCPCVPTLILFYSRQIQYCSKSGDWLARLRQHKTSTFSSLCQCRETQLQWYKNCFAISGSHSINGKEWCPLFDIYILHFEPRTGMLRHTPLDSSRRQRHIVTVNPWQTDTGKPYCYVESLYNMISIFITIPAK